MGTELVISNMRRIIRDSGLKQKAVAERMGIKGNQLSAMLTGRRLIGVCDVMSFCTAMNVAPNDLFVMTA